MQGKIITEFLIGSDPEVFLVDKNSHKVVSAIPFIPGNKWEPVQIDSLSKGHCIQTDNIMVEWCVPAANNPNDLFKSIMDCVDYTNSVIPNELEVLIKASATLEDQYLADRAAKKFGCEPDFNAWDLGMPNQSCNPKTAGNFRSCGGHIHVGYNNSNPEVSMELVKMLDITLGIPSILLDPDKERKKLYGKAGAFRFKDYGVEYRVLSNFWIKEIELVNNVFKGVERAIELVNERFQLTDQQQLDIQTCINTGDEVLAYKLMNEFKLEKVLAKSLIFAD